MSNKLQKETNYWKFPVHGTFMSLLFLVFLGFQLTSKVVEGGGVSHPTEVSAADPQKTSGKTADFFVEEAEEKEEENQEEKSSKRSLGTGSTPFGFHGLKPFLIVKSFVSPAIGIYPKISLYLLFQNLRLDLS
ncbi:hypothetical protein [Cyclobacterium jeungdonense]|uniref:Uncharacterized protein n=1 Tax=Cyclobacterium jeungdonense TaxID=708087 RepID=A0ABT8C9P9_9BACT|nr:hypothetical protein [Cyclobacterium jeungdonense]MDN3689530.1 hypothetical protein [Cyclobacterium jeungdonense]